MDLVNLVAGVSGAVVGGGIAGYFSIKATEKAFKNQRLLAQENEAQLLNNFLLAIYDELDTLYDRYSDTVGGYIEELKEGDALNFYYPVVSDFFIVYNGNSFLLGKIDDDVLRKKIVATYTLAKGLIDSFHLNNELVSKFEFANKLYYESKSDIHKEQASAHYQQLIAYAKTLKAGHYEFKEQTLSLLALLRKRDV